MLLTAACINRDVLEESLFNVEQKTKLVDEEECLELLSFFKSIVTGYIELYSFQIQNLVFKKYTDSNSADYIVGFIGSKGVSVNDQGISLFNSNHGLSFKVNKGDWLVYDNENYINIDNIKKRNIISFWFMLDLLVFRNFILIYWYLL